MARCLTERDAALGQSSDFTDGVRAITPMVVSIVPFGIAIGAAAAGSGLSTIGAWSGSLFLLGGSAQLTMIQVLDGGSAAAVAIVAALLINARLLVYGAGTAAWFPTTRLRGRLLLAVPVVDQLYLLSTTEFRAPTRDEAARRRFYAGAAIHLWLAWIVAQSIGALIGNGVPPWLHLEAASPIALSGLLAMAVTNRSAILAAAVAGSFAVLTIVLEKPSLIVFAILAGVACGSMILSAATEVDA